MLVKSRADVPPYRIKDTTWRIDHVETGRFSSNFPLADKLMQIMLDDGKVK